MLSDLSGEPGGLSSWPLTPADGSNMAEPRPVLTGLARLFNESVMHFLALVAADNVTLMCDSISRLGWPGMSAGIVPDLLSSVPTRRRGAHHPIANISARK
jgi:hypothetical protein